MQNARFTYKANIKSHMTERSAKEDLRFTESYKHA